MESNVVRTQLYTQIDRLRSLVQELDTDVSSIRVWVEKAKNDSLITDTDEVDKIEYMTDALHGKIKAFRNF